MNLYAHFLYVLKLLKANQIKKRELGKTLVEEERKRIKLDRELIKAGGGAKLPHAGGGDKAEGGDGEDRGGAEIIKHNIANLQTDIRTFMSIKKDKSIRTDDDNDEEDDKHDEGSKFNEEEVTHARCKTNNIVSGRYVSSESIQVMSYEQIHTSSDASTQEPISGQSKVSMNNTFRPPTRNRVKNFARRRNKTEIGGVTRDIRSFFSTKLGPDGNRVKLDITKLLRG